MARSNTLAWVVGIGTVGVAGLAIYLYERSTTPASTPASGGAVTGTVTSQAGVAAQTFLAQNDSSPSAAKPEVDKALTLAALDHLAAGQPHATNAVAQGANATEKQALQMAGYTV